MRTNIQVVITFLLMGVCCALRGEEAADADALIAHIKERITYLESLYEQGIDVETEDGRMEEGDEEPVNPHAQRVVYLGLYELRRLKFLSDHRPSPLEEGYEEALIVRNPKYSFIVTKGPGNSGYAVLDLYDNRDGVLPDQTTNGLIDDTPKALVGLYVGLARLRDLLESDDFKVESVEKRENQYRLAFRSNILEDDCNRILGGELFFNAEDYSLEELNYQGEFFIPDRVIPWTRQLRYTYGDWEGVKYPKSKESRFSGNEIVSHSRTIIRSFHLGSPNKKEFYLKYYGIPEPASPKNAPSPAIFIAVGLILIGMGIYLKRRAAAGARSHTNNGAKNDVHEI
ncbi:MAG: hypothetical protein IJH68_07820 [Thermoguttaceae bacterium]|nr:hypothetical protein [Thermoguttaceae bacterium]